MSTGLRTDDLKHASGGLSADEFGAIIGIAKGIRAGLTQDDLAARVRALSPEGKRVADLLNAPDGTVPARYRPTLSQIKAAAGL